MTSFYADPGVGGDGSTTTDDSDATTGLGNGGFWTRLVPMFKNIVAIANNAKASAASAVNSPGTSATSSTPIGIGLGQIVVALAQTGKTFSLGQTVIVASTASPLNWMAGPITAYNSSTGSMTVQVTNVSGTGTFSAWTVSLSGPAGVTGVLNELRGADIVSAATVDLTTVTGNFVAMTGTANITTFNLANGSERLIYSNGTFTLKNGANLVCPGGADIVCAAGDLFAVRAFGTNAVFIHSYTRSTGKSVGESMTMLYASTIPTVANFDATGIFSSAYNKYTIEIENLTLASAAQLLLQLAIGGGVITSATYSSASASGVLPAPSTSLAIGNQTCTAFSLTLEVRTVNGTCPKGVGSRGFGLNGTSYYAIFTEGAMVGTPATVTGFRLTSTVNLTGGVVRVFGHRNS
jgi:hypothetical protein